MELEPNMYVRTDNGIIGKIYEQIGDMFTYKDSNRDYITYGLSHNEILKASHNIIDILEKGDYVNGHRVEEIDFENEEIYTDSEYYCGIVEFCNIKSVITHEQMEQMAYKVGE